MSRIEQRHPAPIEGKLGEYKFSVNHLDKTPLEKIANFYNEVVKEARSENAELTSYALLQKAVSRLPGAIPEDKKKEALEKMKSEDPGERSMGKRAFQFLSLPTIFTVVNANLVEPDSNQGKDIKENRDDMLISTLIFVMENANKINQKSRIFRGVHNLAQQGVFSYLCEAHMVPLQIDRSRAKEGILLVRRIAELRNRAKNLTNEEIFAEACEISKETEIAVDKFINYLMVEESPLVSKETFIEEGVYEDEEGDDCAIVDDYENNKDTRLKVKATRKALEALEVAKGNVFFSTPIRLKYGVEVSDSVRLKYGIEDDVERKEAEISRLLRISDTTISRTIDRTNRWFRKSPEAKRILKDILSKKKT